MYENGVIFEFECDFGYRLNGSSTNICLDGLLALKPPTCERRFISERISFCQLFLSVVDSE